MNITDKYILKKLDGFVLCSNIEKNCENNCILNVNESGEKHNCQVTDSERRRVHIKTEDGYIYYCTLDKNAIKSPKIFKRNINFLKDFLRNVSKLESKITEDRNSFIKKLKHNTTTYNAHSLQEIYSFISEESLSGSQRGRIAKVEKQILKRKNKAANLVMKLLKYTRLTKSEFSVFEKLFVKNPKIDKKIHNIRKVFLNVSHVFFEDFTDKDVVVQVTNSSEKAFFDYESIAVVFVHIMNNAQKYTLPKSKLAVNFQKESKEIVITIDMISLKIDDEEISKIFEDGFSSKRARGLNLAGSGIGMNLAKRLLHLNDGRIEIKTNVNPEYAKTKSRIEYENNVFKIILPSTKSS